ncbi:MAG TPA: short-chain fatty acyl-CoA regulator family protein [Streptosporangiaceae bacterium]|nr:short-chain fatty acyl-CoA regulator family protein [Streptosporangiaceae bacterium]
MSPVTKARVGVRLRRFREERGLTQAALASALAISPSYVNQLESNQRPMTASVLLRLASVFDADLQQFSADDADRLVAQFRDVLTDPSVGEPISMAEIRELAVAMPAVGRYVMELHRRYRHGRDVNETIMTRIDAGAAGSMSVPPPMAYEEVQELFYARRNYFPALDLAAEQIFTEAGLVIGDAAAGIADRLARRHGIRVTELPAGERTVKRRYDPAAQVLALSPLLNPGQRAFQLATHLASVELADEIDQIVAEASLSSDETRALTRIGLASYFAGALVLPYRQFLDAAEDLGYDIVLLQRRFHVGYETVAHRLSTLQRPGARGVPFIFVRVDRAGNISKRQSATSFHFSRVGGSCPLWNVYEAFAHPAEIQTQLAQMPDGRSYLWIARTVSRRYGGYGTLAKTFAIGLGCDLRHAHRLVYSHGLDLASPSALIPIGPGCKVCDRDVCPQRAFPAIGKPLDANPHHSRFIPYAPLMPLGDQG